MTPRQLFVLVLRAVGLFALARNLPHVIEGIAIAAAYGPAYQRLLADRPTELVVWLLQILAQVALPLYLLTAPRWLVNWAVRSRLPECDNCGYRLTGLPAAGRCPECGWPYRLRSDADPTLPDERES